MRSVLRVAIAMACAAVEAASMIGGAQAATTTSSFAVTITITADCSITSTNTLAFGSVGLLTTNTDASAALGVHCTSTTPYNIGLNAGTGSGATVASRKMTGPASATIDYSLYTTGARSTVWGNTVGTDTVAAIGSGAAQSYTIYGRVPASATTPAPGSYSDTITVTVTF